MTNSKLNKKVKELAINLGFTKIAKNIKVRSTDVDELAGYVIIMANYMMSCFDGMEMKKESERVLRLLKLFLAQINFISTTEHEFPTLAIAA